MPFLAVVSAAVLESHPARPQTFSVKYHQLDFVTPGSSPR